MLKRQNKLNPGLFEILLGLAYVGVHAGNWYYKYHAETMIFLLNPCHVVAVSTNPHLT